MCLITCKLIIDVKSTTYKMSTDLKTEKGKLDEGRSCRQTRESRIFLRLHLYSATRMILKGNVGIFGVKSYCHY